MSSRIEGLLVEDELYKKRTLVELNILSERFIQKLRDHDKATGLPETNRCEEILDKLLLRDANFVKERLGMMYQLLTGLRDNTEIYDDMLELLVAQCRKINSRVVDSYIKVSAQDCEETFEEIKQYDARLLAEINQ